MSFSDVYYWSVRQNVLQPHIEQQSSEKDIQNFRLLIME